MKFSWFVRHKFITYDGRSSDLHGNGKTPREALLDLASKYDAVAAEARLLSELDYVLEAAQKVEEACKDGASITTVDLERPPMRRVSATARIITDFLGLTTNAKEEA